jgi:hypothetical protein
MKKYRLSEEQYDKLMEACKPVPYLVVGGYAPVSLQERANTAWQQVAADFKVKWDTIKPAGSDDHDFFAEPIDE